MNINDKLQTIEEELDNDFHGRLIMSEENYQWMQNTIKQQHERIKELEQEKGASFETANLEAGWIKKLEGELSEKRIRIAEMEHKLKIVLSHGKERHEAQIEYLNWLEKNPEVGLKK